MRTPTLSSVQFIPGDPANIRTVEDLVRYVRDLENRTGAALAALTAGHLDEMFAAPTKPRTGDIRFADGTQWNPGSGRGIYYFDATGGIWIQLG